MKNRRFMQLTLIALVTGCFIAGSHLLYSNILQMWNKGLLEDLAARSVVRTEMETDLAISTLVDIKLKGLITCSHESIRAYRGYVMSEGSIKDIRLRSNGKTCAVFTTDQLQNNLHATDIWQSGRNAAIRLGVFTKNRHKSLTIWWQDDTHDLVAEMSTGSLLYDMVPIDLRPHLKMQISLPDGTKIASYSPDQKGYKKHHHSGAEQISFTASSGRYPITAKLTIDKAHMWIWNNKSSMVIDNIACLIGLIVGFLASRAVFPPLGPIIEIDEAITNGEFIPYFQPIINLESSEIAGFEMLARWIKPDGTVIPPNSFIHLAENFGRIDALLFSLLRTAGQEVGFELRNNPNLKLTFNVTPEQFLDPTFLPRLLSVVKLAGLPSDNLVAEITERQPLADLELACRTIAQYKKHGIRIAIDDAGTGHNGLSSLQKLDVATLKLDKIFMDGIVDNERSRQMIEMLANLAHQYKMNVVAEGIESPDQAVAARSMGIQEGQGYYFSRPLPALKLLSLLSEQRQPLIQNNIPRQKKAKKKKLRAAI